MNFWIILAIASAILGILAGIAIAMLPRAQNGLSLTILSLLATSTWGWDIMMYLNNSGTPTDEIRTISMYFDEYSINNKRDTQAIGVTAAMIAGIATATVRNQRRKLSGQPAPSPLRHTRSGCAEGEA